MVACDFRRSGFGRIANIDTALERDHWPDALSYASLLGINGVRTKWLKITSNRAVRTDAPIGTDRLAAAVDQAPPALAIEAPRSQCRSMNT